MSTFLESTEALKTRCLEVHLTEAEIQALIDNNLTSLARLAFVLGPPETTATDDQIRGLFGDSVTPNIGTIASTKRLIFEAQTMVVGELKNKIQKKEEILPTTMAVAERDTRITAQRKRLGGLLFKGAEENAHASYDLVLQMLEKDALLYLGPEKFQTRRFELQQKKTIQRAVVGQRAFRRRALAFDLVGACEYNVMNQYQSELVQHLQESAPPGYNEVTVQQVLRADRAAFLLLAERLTTLKPKPDGTKPLEEALPTVLSHPSVSFHLLPLAKQPDRPPKDSKWLKRSQTSLATQESPNKFLKVKGKGKGKGKGKRDKGRGPNVPKDLIGKALETSDGDRICWPFNMSSGCKDAAVGNACSRGLHVCAEPGCGKAHSLLQHK
ncbi:unnamed protein product [Durusdinium trenchii]|uniref:Uncharacterized protein n=1 Tax=Durusdinium trenchii TaxID=1381693 RepID=A0ABP0SE97_9DINO